MDLLYALDDRFQSGAIEPSTIAPVARLLGADTVWVTGDAAFDRFRTPRPELVHDLYGAEVEGLGDPVPYGDPCRTRPTSRWSTSSPSSDRRIGEPIPPVELVPVDDPLPVIRAKDDVVVVAGSGDGLVDAAAAGLIDGSELIRYAGSFGSEGLGATDGTISQVIVTDTNRQPRPPLAELAGRRRLHRGRRPGDRPTSSARTTPMNGWRCSTSRRRGRPPSPCRTDRCGPARSAYGEPFAYRPEDRPAMAVDGDPATAWRVADRAPAEGEFIRLDVAESIDHVTLHQPAVRRPSGTSARSP